MKQAVKVVRGENCQILCQSPPRGISFKVQVHKILDFVININYNYSWVALSRNKKIISKTIQCIKSRNYYFIGDK